MGNSSQSYRASPAVWNHAGECILSQLQPDRSVNYLHIPYGWKAELTYYLSW